MKEEITTAEAVDKALANAKLEGIEPSGFTRVTLEQLRRGEITLQQYRDMGMEHYADRGR
jgi:hypothetical protein